MAKDFVKSIRKIAETPTSTYNIQVEGNRNYFVNGILTHNCDDPHNAKEAESEADRTNAINFLSRSLSTRVVSKRITTKILVMQRLHEQDATGYLLSKHPNIFHICLPAEASADIKPAELEDHYTNGLLDPVRLDREALTSHKESLGSYGYAGQMMQRPSPESGGQLKKAWFKEVDFNELPQGLVWNFTIDSAYTESEQNDPSALMAFAVKENKLYIRSCESVRLEFPELCKYIKSYVAQHGYSSSSRIWVEPKASGKSIVQTLKKATDLNILEAKNPTKDKVARVSDIAPAIEAGKVHIVRGSWTDSFIGECTAFPNGQHDDKVDTLVMALQNGLKSGGTTLWFTT